MQNKEIHTIRHKKLDDYEEIAYIQTIIILNWLLMWERIQNGKFCLIGFLRSSKKIPPWEDILIHILLSRDRRTKHQQTFPKAEEWCRSGTWCCRAYLTGYVSSKLSDPLSTVPLPSTENFMWRFPFRILLCCFSDCFKGLSVVLQLHKLSIELEGKGARVVVKIYWNNLYKAYIIAVSLVKTIHTSLFSYHYLSRKGVLFHYPFPQKSFSLTESGEGYVFLLTD